MSAKYNIAVLGATGVVGQALLELLSEREFPVGQVFALASERTAGATVHFGRKTLDVEDVAEFDWTQVQIAFFSAGASVSAIYAPIAAESGCVVIDNTSEFRAEPDVPLIVPEVNPLELANFRNRNIIANPNCSTIQMLVALNPIHQAVGIARINVATYQSVSGSGKEAIAELVKQAGGMLNGIPAEAKVHSKPIAFNVLPQIDAFQDNGYTKEEMKMVWETQKILGDENVLVNPTAVRVPVMFGHAEAIHIETREQIDAEGVKALLREAPGVELFDNDDDYPTPLEEGSGKDAVYVGRVRNDISHPNGINLWVVADNIRKGAALNSIQIAELLIHEYL